MKPLIYAASGLMALACWAATPGWAQPAGHQLSNPTEMKWEDATFLPKGAKATVIEGPMNEAKPFTVRLRLPANYRIPPHTHPGIEHVTVLSGSVNVGMGEKFDEKGGMTVQTGGVIILQPKEAHYAWTRRPTVLQLHGMGPWGIDYVNPADDPRKR